jgi:hypothetical protein
MRFSLGTDDADAVRTSATTLILLLTIEKDPLRRDKTCDSRAASIMARFMGLSMALRKPPADGQHFFNRLLSIKATMAST